MVPLDDSPQVQILPSHQFQNTMTDQELDKQIREDIQPLVDMFTGADGGTGFARFRHEFLPDVYKMDTEESRQFKLMLKRMSALASMMSKPRK